MYWPKAPPRKKSQPWEPPKGVGIVGVENHGTAILYNLDARIRFDLGAQESEGGVTSIEVRLPLMTQLRPATDQYRFFITDESGLGGLVILPEMATADIPGIGRREIKVTKRKLTFMDNVPMLPLSFPKPQQPDKQSRGKKGEK